MTGSSFAEIDLTALEENLFQVRNQVGDCPILAVVKANAYGHGAVEVARFLSGCRANVSLFGVAFIEEGLALREAGITEPILLLTGCPKELIPDLIQHQLTPVVFDLETLTAINREAMKAGKRVNVHLKVDTGMGRLGIVPADVHTFMEKAHACPMISVEGLLTHFAEADFTDLSFARKQLDSIKGVIAELSQKGVVIPFCHLSNSAAVLHFKASHLDLVRPGLMLYGYSSLSGSSAPRCEEKEISLTLKPVMRVKARILALKTVPKGTSISYGRTFVTVRESRIATVAIGYADGYPFSLSNRGIMIAKGTVVPVVGRVCMDMTMLDVTEVPALSTNDWVTVIGAEGGSAIWADRLAQLANTHTYEILCGIGPRVERRYVRTSIH